VIFNCHSKTDTFKNPDVSPNYNVA